MSHKSFYNNNRKRLDKKVKRYGNSLHLQDAINSIMRMQPRDGIDEFHDFGLDALGDQDDRMHADACDDDNGVRGNVNIFSSSSVYMDILHDKVLVIGHTYIFPNVQSRNGLLALTDNGKQLSYVSVVVVPHNEDDLKCTPICTCGSNNFLNQQLLEMLEMYCKLPDHDWSSMAFKKHMASTYEDYISIDSYSLCIHAK